MYFWGIDTTFIAIATIVGLIMLFYRSDRIHLKLFPFFLLYTLLNELFAGYMVEHMRDTTEIYNVYAIVQFLFYTYLLSNFLQNKNVIRLVRFIQPIYVLLSFLNLLFFQTLRVYNSITYSIGCLVIVAMSIYYFYELFKQKRIVQLTHEPAFWISTGLLFFFTCSFPLLATANILEELSPATLEALQKLLTLLNVMLYSIFTISFLCQIKVPKPTS